MRYSTTSFERKVGILILIGLVSMAVLFFLSGPQEKLFPRYVRYQVTYNQGYGLGIGSLVRVRGVESGVVENYEIAEGGDILLQLKVLDRFSTHIRTNSLAVLIVAPFFGDSEIDIRPGQGLGEVAPEGFKLTSHVPPDFLAAFSEVAEQTSGMLADIKSGEGHIGKTVVSLQEAASELVPATKGMAKIASSIQPSVDNINEITSDLKPIIKHAAKAAENLPAISENTASMIKHLEGTSEIIRDSSEDIKVITGMVRETLEEMKDTQADVRQVLSSLRAITEDIEQITGQFAEGEGTIGKLIQDDEIYEETKDVVDTAHEIVEDFTRTRVVVTGDHMEYFNRGVGIAHLAVQVIPRPSRYFHIGGAFYTFRDDSDATSEDGFELAPEILLAQKLWNNRLTLRVGLLEGRFGGGVDMRLWQGYGFSKHHAEDPTETTSITPWRQDLSLSLDVRDTFDSESFDENIDGFLVRSSLHYRFFRFFHVYVGADNVLDSPGISFGIGFAYQDEDITKVLGLMSATK